ncbi:MAG: YqgE/AlgH family protein [Nitrospiraceae bacterium]
MAMNGVMERVPLGKGIFLVASPALRDPNFRQTVVLLCEHNDEGALGFVLNRPTAMNLSEVLPQVPIMEAQQHALYSGGPVQTNQVMVLYRLSDVPEGSHTVLDGVCLGGDFAILDRILTDRDPHESFRAFAGYSGWGPGQLENEMKSGSWITIPADSPTVFDREPSTLWHDLVTSLGEPFKMYADMPADPSLN